MQAGVTIHSPNEAWHGNEVEKRSYGFRLADMVSDAYEDWYWVMDADQVVTDSSDLHTELSTTELDVAESWFWERNGLNDPTRAPVRNLFRAIPGIYLHGNHYTYLTPDGRFLWGDGPSRLEPSLVTRTEIEHRTWLRPRMRREKQNQYYRRRDMTQAEFITKEAKSA